MSLRTFFDRSGQEWQVFDVVPREDERRNFDRRSSLEMHLQDPDERRDRDRRYTVGGGSPQLSGVTRSWLCFQSGTERRRLSPIPNDWVHLSDARLEAFRQQARPVTSDGAMAQDASAENATTRK
jgi:hypothetical protein